MPPQALRSNSRDIDEAEFVPFGGREFAQAQVPCFFASDEANVDRAILQDDFIGEAFGGFDLIFGERRGVEVDRAVVVAHVEGDGRHVEEADEGGGEDMLSGVLLHVVAAAGGVDLAADFGSRLQGLWRGFKIMNDAAVFGVGDFGDFEVFVFR